MKRDARQVLTEWLVLTAQGGDEAAFRELHQLWTADFRRLARVRVERDEHAEEVVQDAWIAIARGLARLDDPACFPRWGMQVVQRRAVDWVRRRQRERHQENVLAAGAAGPAEADANPPPDDETMALRRAVQRLAPADQELVHLFYGAERSVAEIAVILEVPTGTVKSRLFNLRERLKTQIEKETP